MNNFSPKLSRVNTPKVSVVMPVYNGAEFLSESIPSILNQTFTDFEFIIIDDCSTDNSLDIINVYQKTDPRIVLWQNQVNLGIAKTLNRGIDASRGKYIARFDCDDFSYPYRLKLQHDYMEQHPEVIALGGNIKYFGLSSLRARNYPSDFAALKCFLLFNTPLAHPTVMLRKELMLKNNFVYSDQFCYAEDYELWSRMATQFQIANLPQLLIKYRIHQRHLNSEYAEKQNISLRKIRQFNLQHLQFEFSEEELTLHNVLSDRRFSRDPHQFSQIIVWINKLLAANKKVNYYQQKAFEENLAFQTSALILYWLKIKPTILFNCYQLKLKKRFFILVVFKVLKKIVKKLKYVLQIK